MLIRKIMYFPNLCTAKIIVNIWINIHRVRWCVLLDSIIDIQSLETK